MPLSIPLPIQLFEQLFGQLFGQLSVQLSVQSAEGLLPDLPDIPGLRADLPLPELPLWYPPALGWWLLCLLLIGGVLLVLMLIKWRGRVAAARLSATFIAQQQLLRIKNDYAENQDKALLIKALSTLIRRVNISLFKRDETAALTGREWLAHLDQFTDNNEFSDGIGQIMITAPYQAIADYDSTALLELISQWLARVSANVSIGGNAPKMKMPMKMPIKMPEKSKDSKLKGQQS